MTADRRRRESSGQQDEGADNGPGAGSGSGFDRLREQLTGYAGARAQKWADSLGDKLADITDKLAGTAENGGPLPGAGARVLRGDPPVRALVTEKARNVKDSVTGKVKDAFGGGGDGTGGRKPGDTKVTNIVEVLDVGVPLRTVYDHWTQFEEFGSFLKGVQNVSVKEGEPASDWRVKVGPSTRSWQATTLEQIPDDRIVWTSQGAKGTTRGAVSFHELGPNLTRIVVVVEYHPAGFFEKTGNLWRAQGRRLRLDLKHFQRYVTLTDEEPEGWRGEIRDGEIVRTHEEGLEDDADEDEEYGGAPEEDGAGR